MPKAKEYKRKGEMKMKLFKKKEEIENTSIYLGAYVAACQAQRDFESTTFEKNKKASIAIDNLCQQLGAAAELAAGIIMDNEDLKNALIKNGEWNEECSPERNVCEMVLNTLSK